jgi:omega-6 fatty acid desaturase (delta-12 desaturase)
MDVTLYFVALAGVLFGPNFWARLVFAVIAGMAQAKLMVLAHDAAHGSLVISARFNRILGIVGMTLVHYNFRLWNYEHHRMHHPNANDDHPDAFKPLSKREFDALPFWHQCLHRIYRSPNVIGLGLYYILERYWWTKVVAPAYLPSYLRLSARKHSWLLVGWVVVLLILFSSAPYYSNHVSSIEAIVLGLLLPFFAFQCQNAFALYSQHTDLSVPWFRNQADRQNTGRVELLSVDLRTPRVMGWFYHDIFAHPVHHLFPTIPCYRVRAAQDHLANLLGSHAVVRKFGPAWLVNTMQCCKLYDWENQRWLDFRGRPTTRAFAPQATSDEITSPSPVETVASLPTS